MLHGFWQIELYFLSDRISAVLLCAFISMLFFQIAHILVTFLLLLVMSIYGTLQRCNKCAHTYKLTAQQSYMRPALLVTMGSLSYWYNVVLQGVYEIYLCSLRLLHHPSWRCLHVAFATIANTEWIWVDIYSSFSYRLHQGSPKNLLSWDFCPHSFSA